MSLSGESGVREWQLPATHASLPAPALWRLFFSEQPYSTECFQRSTSLSFPSSPPSSSGNLFLLSAGIRLFSFNRCFNLLKTPPVFSGPPGPTTTKPPLKPKCPPWNQRSALFPAMIFRPFSRLCPFCPLRPSIPMVPMLPIILILPMARHARPRAGIHRLMIVRLRLLQKWPTCRGSTPPTPTIVSTSSRAPTRHPAI